MLIRKEYLKKQRFQPIKGETYIAKVLVVTWYILWFIPVFRSESIQSSNM